MLSQASNKKTRLRLIVTVKAYPSVSIRYNELVCCAGITEDKKWIRLYPVPYRSLPQWQQFEKYDIIEVDVERRDFHKDNRPESWRPLLDSLKKIGKVETTRGNWDARLEWIKPTLLSGFAELQALQESENKSLGAFRPSRILDIEVSPDKEEWTPEQQAALNQGDLFDGFDRDPIEKVPYRFRIGFLDERGKDHWLSVIDWEFFQLWRKERDRFQSEEKAAEQVRKKLEWVCAGDKDLILYAGNLANPVMRKSFMILGCCYPKDDPQMTFL